MSGGAHPAPHRGRAPFVLLLAAASAAPLFWLGQLMLSYAVTAYGCYPGDQPGGLLTPASLSQMVLIFDGVAVLGALAGGAVSYRAWRRVRHEKQGGHHTAIATGEGRTRFLALWGLYSSAGFLAAILFGGIAAIMVPPCAI